MKKFKKIVMKILCGIGVDHSNRMGAFFENMDLFKSSRVMLWYAFREAYIDTDYHGKWAMEVKEFLFDNFAPDQRKYLMTKEEMKMYKALPDEVTIYRGMSREEFDCTGDDDGYGISWTLDKKIAEFFAHKWQRRDTRFERTVHTIVAEKSDIVAIFNDREESEVIYFPMFSKES